MSSSYNKIDHLSSAAYSQVFFFAFIYCETHRIFFYYYIINIDINDNWGIHSILFQAHDCMGILK